MKTNKIALLAILFCLGLGACNSVPESTPTQMQPTSTATPTPVPAPVGWKLVWHDEFDGKAGDPPNPAYWGFDTGGRGWGNSELEYYEKGSKNAYQDGEGFLVILTKKLDKTESNGLQCWYGGCQYSSARILTKGKFEFQYGRIEGRIKIPSGKGIWPAFWLLGNDIGSNPWPHCGEIDVMENIGRTPASLYGTIHGPGYSGSGGIQGQYQLVQGNLADDYHLYAVEWDPELIRWYFDGQPYFQVAKSDVPGDWVFDHPFFLILNTAVGGGWPGMPNESTVFPQTMLVDYIRVFQREAK
jgi:beta-glucanase (GH16 family)